MCWRRYCLNDYDCCDDVADYDDDVSDDVAGVGDDDVAGGAGAVVAAAGDDRRARLLEAQHWTHHCHPSRYCSTSTCSSYCWIC